MAKKRKFVLEEKLKKELGLDDETIKTEAEEIEMIKRKEEKKKYSFLKHLNALGKGRSQIFEYLNYGQRCEPGGVRVAGGVMTGSDESSSFYFAIPLIGFGVTAGLGLDKLTMYPHREAFFQENEEDIEDPNFLEKVCMTDEIVHNLKSGKLSDQVEYSYSLEERGEIWTFSMPNSKVKSLVRIFMKYFDPKIDYDEQRNMEKEELPKLIFPPRKHRVIAKVYNYPESSSYSGFI